VVDDLKQSLAQLRPSSSACQWDSRIMAEMITSADLAVAALQAIERRF
jgi:hypothetical protein